MEPIVSSIVFYWQHQMVPCVFCFVLFRFFGSFLWKGGSSKLHAFWHFFKWMKLFCQGCFSFVYTCVQGPYFCFRCVRSTESMLVTLRPAAFSRAMPIVIALCSGVQTHTSALPHSIGVQFFPGLQQNPRVHCFPDLTATVFLRQGLCEGWWKMLELVIYSLTDLCF